MRKLTLHLIPYTWQLSGTPSSMKYCYNRQRSGSGRVCIRKRILFSTGSTLNFRVILRLMMRFSAGPGYRKRFSGTWIKPWSCINIC